MKATPKPDYKFNEASLLQEFKEYVDKTYIQHYAGKNKIQALEGIIDAGHGEGFCIGSAMKYLPRYGKKGGKNRDDIMKAMHFCLLMLHVHDLNEEN